MIMAKSPSKFMTVQHYVNPSMLPVHEVRYFEDTAIYFVVGQVLFYEADGGHWVGDDRLHQFVGVYDQKTGVLSHLLNLAIVQSITPFYGEDAE